MSFSLLLDAEDIFEDMQTMQFVIMGIVMAIILAIIITVIVKAVQHSHNLKSLESTIAENFKEINKDEKDSKSPTVTCEYCGTLNDRTNKSCTSCGASLNNSKKH